MGRKRNEQPAELAGTPPGQIGQFIAHVVDTRYSGDVARLCDKLAEHGLPKSQAAVWSWISGSRSPKLSELPALSSALGYKSWFALVAAIERHTG